MDQTGRLGFLRHTVPVVFRFHVGLFGGPVLVVWMTRLWKQNEANTKQPPLGGPTCPSLHQ